MRKPKNQVDEKVFRIISDLKNLVTSLQFMYKENTKAEWDTKTVNIIERKICSLESSSVNLELDLLIKMSE